MKKLIFIFVAILIFPLATAFGEGSLIDQGGIFLGADLSRDPSSIGLEIGAEAFNGEVFSVNGSLKLLVHEHVDEILSGFTLGIRVAVPKRISPYLGIRAFYGYSELTKDADEDNVDNDMDGKIDEAGEQVTVKSADMATFFPEVGLHLWINESSRFTLNYAYNFSSFGRRYDFKVVGLAYSFFFE